jgi:hypothetical protein
MNESRNVGGGYKLRPSAPSVRLADSRAGLGQLGLRQSGGKSPKQNLRSL